MLQGKYTMVASDATFRLEELAQQIFELITQVCLATPRPRRQAGDLKETEFLTLSILHQHSSLIVGDIQRMLGVLPAQMSRIIRALEARDRPLIECRINQQDKRKIDVALTPAGQEAFLEHQTSRLDHVAKLLGNLATEELDQMRHLIRRLHGILQPIPPRH